MGDPVCLNADHPDESFPGDFYFNAELMPKWGACWGLAQLTEYIEPGVSAGRHSVWDIYCSIDHGGVESAYPDDFLWAIHEVILILLTKRAAIMATLAEQTYGPPQEIYLGLVRAALRMQELTVAHRCAIWASGGESAKGRVVALMRRPPPELAPSRVPVPGELKARLDEQVRRLHALAKSEPMDRDLRKRLQAIRAT